MTSHESREPLRDNRPVLHELLDAGTLRLVRANEVLDQAPPSLEPGAHLWSKVVVYDVQEV